MYTLGEKRKCTSYLHLALIVRSSARRLHFDAPRWGNGNLRWEVIAAVTVDRDDLGRRGKPPKRVARLAPRVEPSLAAYHRSGASLRCTQRCRTQLKSSLLRAQSNSLSTSPLWPCFTFVGPILAGPAMLGSAVRVETRMAPGLASPVPIF